MRFLVEKVGNLYHAYHGTKKDFDKFKRKYVGNTGIEHGYGYYFTNRKDIAQSYGNIIIEADLEINNPVSTEDVTFSKNQIKEYIRKYIDPTGDGYISNYGDVNQEGYEKVLDKCASDLVLYESNDVELLSELLYWGRREDDESLEAIPKVFGKDGIIYTGYDTFYGEKVENYIVFSNGQMHNIKKYKEELE